MEKILNIYKPIGLTPLQLIQNLRRRRSEYEDQKIGFAGRLDPLASGVMLLMIGSETKNREKYLSLSKTYEFEVLFGMSTDTYDTLGILQNINLQLKPGNLEEQIKTFISSKVGKQTQQYPPYSSIEVAGKPLYQWARENKLAEIQIPEKEIEIYNFEFLDILEIPAGKIHKRIISNIKSVDGDFRQEKILKKWNEFFSSSSKAIAESRSNNSTQGRTINAQAIFSVAKFKINCSSGTYVRSLAHELGNLIGTGAIALSILRTQVGNYKLEDSIKL